MRRWLVHASRVAMIIAIVGMIHLDYRNRISSPDLASIAEIDVSELQRFFPEAQQAATDEREPGLTRALDAQEQVVGSLLSTSPQSDHIIGFSGPTSVVLAFDAQDILTQFEIVESGDTPEHLDQVLASVEFKNELVGQSWDELKSPKRIDGVSGATLTSLAIQEAIAFRLSGERPSIRFADPPQLEWVKQLFPSATRLEIDPDFNYRWSVYQNDSMLGYVLRSSPVSEQQVGFHGPTDSLLGLTLNLEVVGMTINESFDEEPYISYVRDEKYFRTRFNEMDLEGLASSEFDPFEFEGVSGATMTSQRVAEDIVELARHHSQDLEQQSQPSPIDMDDRGASRFITTLISSSIPWRTVGTLAMIVAGLVLGFTKLRGNRWVRIPFQVLLIVYLGVMNGDLLSQAMFVGWAQHSIPWSRATGLVLLTGVAFLIPIGTKNNIYCNHLCAHGAVQQLLRKRIKWQWRLPKRWQQRLKWIPPLLLVWVVVVAMLPLPFRLVNIEPFDAWVFRVAGWPTILLAVVGLAASVFEPMAYCRFGCPTGSLLGFLRLNAKSGEWTRADWVALGTLTLAMGLLLLPQR